MFLYKVPGLYLLSTQLKFHALLAGKFEIREAQDDSAGAEGKIVQVIALFTGGLSTQLFFAH